MSPSEENPMTAFPVLIPNTTLGPSAAASDRSGTIGVARRIAPAMRKGRCRFIVLSFMRFVYSISIEHRTHQIGLLFFCVCSGAAD